jgi:hypothetical protein
MIEMKVVDMLFYPEPCAIGVETMGRLLKSHDEQAVFYGAACKIGDVFRYFPDDWGFTTAVNLCESIMPSPSEKGNRILIPTTAITAFPRPAGAFG